MGEVRLSNFSWVRARDYFSTNDIVLLPVGSTEQHGPQNPLGTDHLIAYELALEAGRRTGVAVLPPVPYGVSVHHSAFPGTVWVREEVFKEYVRDIVLSLKKHGVKKVVVVNGHGGNLNALLSLSRELRGEGVLTVVFQWWTLPKLSDLFTREELGHAAAAETSLNLFLNGKSVDMSSVVDEKPRKLPTDGLAYFPEYTDDRTKTGVFGVATTACKGRGERVFEIASRALVETIEALRRS
ncbi:MAG: creatininase family protein [Thermofilaceae archaeon]|nr:creatininase family protein [Thermofilaceae archaeon]MDW8004253.1 creatininase family protein [Thermofilaceae archaeon]